MKKKTVIVGVNPEVIYPTGEYPDSSPKVITRIDTSRIFGGCWGEWIVVELEEPKDKKQPLSFDNRRSFKDIKKIGNYNKGGF